MDRQWAGWNMAGDLRQGPSHSGKELSRSDTSPLTLTSHYEATVRSKLEGRRGARLLPFSLHLPMSWVWAGTLKSHEQGWGQGDWETPRLS